MARPTINLGSKIQSCGKLSKTVFLSYSCTIFLIGIGSSLFVQTGARGQFGQGKFMLSTKAIEKTYHLLTYFAFVTKASLEFLYFSLSSISWNLIMD